MKRTMILAALALAGCGGDPFTAGIPLAGEDGGSEASVPDSLSLPPEASVDGQDGESGAHVEAGLPDASTDAAPEAEATDSGEDAGETGTAEAGHDAAPEASGDGCVLATHTDGLGETWQDCTPLGTFDATEAMRACQAHYGLLFTDGGTVPSCWDQACTPRSVCYAAPYGEYCWTYGGAGNVTKVTSMSSVCQQQATGQTWE